MKRLINFFKDKKIIFLNKRIFLNIFLIFFSLQIIVFSNFFGIFSCDAFLAKIISGTLIDLTNIERSFSNANQLTVNPLLEQAAYLKAKDMAQKNYFAHISPEGITPWHWFKEVGYDFIYAGENLAVNFTNSNALHQAWLNSYTHRRNILNKNFKEIGIGIAEGIYKGEKAVFVVQLFGTSKENSLLVNFFKDKDKAELNNENILKNLKNSNTLNENNSYLVFQEIPGEEEIMILGLTKTKERPPFFFLEIFNLFQALGLILLLFIIVFISFIILSLFKKIKLNHLSCLLNSLLVSFIIFISILFNAWFLSLINQIS